MKHIVLTIKHENFTNRMVVEAHRIGEQAKLGAATIKFVI
jgi:hypothetical protein